MNLGALTTTGRGWNPLLLLPLLAALLLVGCRTCPIDSCHVRKAHYHNGVKYRARPIWKMQYPAIGEKQKLNREHTDRHREADHSRPLR